MNHKIKKILNFIVADTPVQFTQKCSNNLSDLNILGIDCTTVIFLWPSTLKSWTKPSSTQSLTKVEFKSMQSLSRHISGVHENHNTPTLNWPASLKLISHKFLQLGAAEFPILCISPASASSNHPSLPQTWPLFYITINFTICSSRCTGILANGSWNITRNGH